MDLVTSLPRVECVRRLQEAVGKEWLAAIFGIAVFAQKYDSDFLLAFVRKTLDAQDAPSGKASR